MLIKFEAINRSSSFHSLYRIAVKIESIVYIEEMEDNTLLIYTDNDNNFESKTYTYDELFDKINTESL